MEEFVLKELLKPQEDLSSSSSSSEDLSPNRQSKRKKIVNFVEEVVPGYDDLLFKEHFRMSRKTVQDLIDKFQRSSYSAKPNNFTEISPEKAILLSLWYLANRETFRQISDRFDISLSSAHRTLFRVIDFIIGLKSEYIKWPTNHEKLLISSEFKKKKGFAGVIGCIDGSHIKINKTHKDQDSYINRKGYHSILIQGIVDHKKCFIDVYCGEPGSLHDARLLRRSNIFRKAEEDPTFFGNYYLLGDSAYPSLSWLVPPYKDNGFLSEQQKSFNYRLSSTRIVVENAFGLLKKKFRRLDHFDNLEIKLIVKCVMATCVLHNMCLMSDNSDPIVLPENNIDISDCEPEIEGNGSVAGSRSVARDKRDIIFEDMFNAE